MNNEIELDLKEFHGLNCIETLHKLTNLFNIALGDNQHVKFDYRDGKYYLVGYSE